MTNSSYNLRLSKRADKQFRGLDANVRKRISAALVLLSQDPRPRNARKVIAPKPLLRVRVGDYRIIYAVRDQELVILVVSLGHRKDVYRKLD